MLRKLSIRNIRGIEALDVDIAGPLILMGRNGSGKTSTLDALRYICTGTMKDRLGKNTLKAHLLRYGAKEGSISLETDRSRLGLVIAKSLAQLWEKFDHAIIDSPPLLGVLMVNALAASQQLVIPVQTEFLAVKGLERMVSTLNMVNRSRKQPLPYTIVPTLFDRRTQASLSTLRVLRIAYPEHLWQAYVPVDTRLRDASRAGLTPSQFDGNSRGVIAYRALLKHLLAAQPATQVA